MSVKLLTEHHLEFLSLKGGSSESTLVKMQIVGNLMPRIICKNHYSEQVVFKAWAAKACDSQTGKQTDTQASRHR